MPSMQCFPQRSLESMLHCLCLRSHCLGAAQCDPQGSGSWWASISGFLRHCCPLIGNMVFNDSKTKWTAEYSLWKWTLFLCQSSCTCPRHTCGALYPEALLLPSWLLISPKQQRGGPMFCRKHGCTPSLQSQRQSSVLPDSYISQVESSNPY